MNLTLISPMFHVFPALFSGTYFVDDVSEIMREKWLILLMHKEEHAARQCIHSIIFAFIEICRNLKYG